MIIRRKSLVFLVTVILVWGAANFAQAGNMPGASGLFNSPTASIRPAGSLTISYFWQESHNVSFVLGVFPGVEAGLGGRIGTDTNDLPAFRGSFKLKLLEESLNYPALAAGIDIDGKEIVYYLVGSMQLGRPGLRAHGGFALGTATRYPFVGISNVLNPVAITSVDQRFNLPLTTISGEFDGESIHAGIVFKFNNQIEAKLSLTNFRSFGAGISYIY